MATLAQILARRYPGPANLYTMHGADDYAGLVWHVSSPNPKPLEAQIRAHSAAVDTEMAEDAARKVQNDFFTDTRGEDLLWGFETLTITIRAIFTELPATTRTAIQTNHPTAINRFLRMEDKIDEVLNP